MFFLVHLVLQLQFKSRGLPVHHHFPRITSHVCTYCLLDFHQVAHSNFGLALQIFRVATVISMRDLLTSFTKVGIPSVFTTKKFTHYSVYNWPSSSRWSDPHSAAVSSRLHPPLLLLLLCCLALDSLPRLSFPCKR